MTDKSEFDYLLSRDKDTYPVPSDDAVPGTSHMLREQFWFRHDSPAELRDRVIEIVACYPTRPFERVSADRRDQIWECALSTLSETNSVAQNEVPSAVRDALEAALKHESNRLKGEAISLFRWQNASGYRCFVNRGEYEWSVSRWLQGVDYEGQLSAPSAVENRILKSIAAECGNTALRDAIAGLYGICAITENPRVTNKKLSVQARQADRNIKAQAEYARLDREGVRNWVKPLQKAVPEVAKLSRQQLTNIVKGKK